MRWEASGVAKYRKKPVVIEAFRMGIDPRPDWFQDKVTSNEIVTGELLSYPGQPYCDIKTLEGTMHGDYGDYIIRGVKGEIYPCKPDVFTATYESVDESTQDKVRMSTYMATSY